MHMIEIIRKGTHRMIRLFCVEIDTMAVNTGLAMSILAGERYMALLGKAKRVILVSWKSLIKVYQKMTIFKQISLQNKVVILQQK